MGNRAITGLMLLLVVATGIILSWRYLQPLDEKGAIAVTELKKIASATDETSATLKAMAVDVKRIAEATEKAEKCCAEKKVAPKPTKKKKACDAPAPPKVKQAEEKPVAPLATSPQKEEERKPEPKAEAKKCSGADLQLLEDGRIICAPSQTAPTPKTPAVTAEMKCVAPNIRQMMDDGNIACIQPPATVAQAPTQPAPAVVSNVCTDMGLNGSNYVPMVDEHGRAYCAEEIKSSKVLAVVQYVTCTTVGAVAGFQRGGSGGAALGATGSAALTYAGRSYSEGWGWVGCVPGAGVLGYDAIKAATRTKTKTITINTGSGTTGGSTISGATTGGGTIP